MLPGGTEPGLPDEEVALPLSLLGEQPVAPNKAVKPAATTTVPHSRG